MTAIFKSGWHPWNLTPGRAAGAVPGRGCMRNNRCFLIGCAICHTPASPQPQRAPQYVTVAGQTPPMYHPISAMLSSSDHSAFIAIFLFPALNKRKMDSSGFSFFFPQYVLSSGVRSDGHSFFLFMQVALGWECISKAAIC